MSILYPADYTAPEVADRTPSTQKCTAAKTKIKAYVTKPMAYDEIVKYINQEYPDTFTGEEAVKLIKEVDAELHPVVKEAPELIEEV